MLEVSVACYLLWYNDFYRNNNKKLKDKLNLIMFFESLVYETHTHTHINCSASSWDKNSIFFFNPLKFEGTIFPSFIM